MVTRLISATGDEIKEMSPMDLKESIFKSEGRVVMGQHLLFAGPGLVRGVTNSELMFAFGADMVMLNTFDLDDLDNNPGLCGLSFQELKEKCNSKILIVDDVSIEGTTLAESRRFIETYAPKEIILYSLIG